MIPTDALVPLASVIGSVLLLVGVLVTALRRKPVEVQDLWTRNDTLQSQMDQLRTDFDTYKVNKDQEFAEYKKEFDKKMEERDKERRALRHIVSVLTDGYDAAQQRINSLVLALTGAGITVPEPSLYVKAAMDAARDVRALQINLEEV